MIVICANCNTIVYDKPVEGSFCSTGCRDDYEKFMDSITWNKPSHDESVKHLEQAVRSINAINY